jgi:hypothetical protein
MPPSTSMRKTVNEITFFSMKWRFPGSALVFDCVQKSSVLLYDDLELVNKGAMQLLDVWITRLVHPT